MATSPISELVLKADTGRSDFLGFCEFKDLSYV